MKVVFVKKCVERNRISALNPPGVGYNTTVMSVFDSHILMSFVSREGLSTRGLFCFSRFFVLVGLFLVAAALFTISTEAVRAQTTATYTVTFEGNWNTQSTPGGVVSGAHFTTLIGAVHNDQVTFWEMGGMATAGVESVAETGSTGTFSSEISGAANGTVKSTVQQGGTSATGSRTFEVEFSRSHPLFTLLSMIGPSPDWFVGVSGLSLLDGEGNWHSSHMVDLFPYDAGTEDGEGFSLGNPDTNPQGTITSLRNQGRFSNVRMARLTFTLKTPPPVIEASEVNTNDELKEFVLDAAGRIKASDTFEKTLRLLGEFRDKEGGWNNGSMYLILLTKRGGVYFHANDRGVEDMDWSEVLFCEAGGSVLNSQGGCFIEYDGASSAYAHPFSASHVPLAHGEEEFVLLGGFDETPEGKSLRGEIELPSTEAGEVDTDNELREFVEDAGESIREAVEDPDIDPAQLRAILRREGPWREEDVYVYIMDEMGIVMFDGADRSREQKDEYAKQYIRDIIQNAQNADKEIVSYVEGGLPRRGYSIRVEVPLDEMGEDTHVYIVGSGYQTEEQQSSSSGGGGGGCAIGENSNGSTSGMFLVLLTLLLAVLLKRHSPQE